MKQPSLYFRRSKRGTPGRKLTRKLKNQAVLRGIVTRSTHKV